MPGLAARSHVSCIPSLPTMLKQGLLFALLASIGLSACAGVVRPGSDGGIDGAPVDAGSFVDVTRDQTINADPHG
jgi:hypothetical protein